MVLPAAGPVRGRLRHALGRRFGSRTLSVVVVVRGPAVFLDACLASVLASEHPVREVLLVADPADEDADLALVATSSTRRRDVRRVPAVHGDTWLDEAVSAASGRYLAFVDADDIVPAGTYRSMLDGLRASGSPMVAGARTSVPPIRTLRPPHEVDVLTRRRVRATVRDAPEALLDLTLTDKVFELDWWRSAGLSLRSWRSTPVTVAEAYLAAPAFDVQPDAVHERHRRDAFRPVDEQARYDAEEVGAWLDAVRAVADLVEQRAPALSDDWLSLLFEHLLPPVYPDVVTGGSRFHDVLAAAVRDLLGRTSELTMARVSVHARCSAWVAAHGSLEDLALVQELLADNPSGLPTRSADRGLIVELPRELTRTPPDAALRIEPVDRRLRTKVDDLVCDADDRVVLRGAAFVEYDEGGTAPALVSLGTPDGLERRPVAVSGLRDPLLNTWAARAYEDHEAAGFAATVHRGDLPDPADGRWSVEVSVGSQTRTHVVRLVDGPGVEPSGHALVLDGLGLDGDTLVLSGRGAAGTARLVGPRGSSDAFPVEASADGFQVGVPLRTALFGDSVLLPAGRYAVEVHDRDGAAVPARWAASVGVTSAETMGERLRVTPGPDARKATVVVAAPVDAFARSAYGRQVLRDRPASAGPRHGRTVLLETFRGRSVGDSPGAVGRSLLARDRAEGLELDIAWVVDDPSVLVPAGARAVPRGSRAWYEAMHGAAAYISNAGAPNWFEKRPGQLHLQTWHGTPLKRIGEDRGPGDFQTWHHRRHIAQQSAGWDAMVSPSRFCSDIFRSALRFPGPMLEVGYPRNDVLLSEEAAGIRARVRGVLGLTGADRVVLYAPTWREYTGQRETKPLYLDAEELTRDMPDSVVLVRGHYNSTGQPDVFPDHPRIHDVTRYPDVADLYLAADALVTDYSSVMFDFALTDKPIVLLVPDLARYRDVERGFYFDLEERAPGPLVETTAGVVESLAAADRYGAARESFRQEFCPFEDGAATARVVEYSLGLLSDPR